MSDGSRSLWWRRGEGGCFAGPRLCQLTQRPELLTGGGEAGCWPADAGGQYAGLGGLASLWGVGGGVVLLIHELPLVLFFYKIHLMKLVSYLCSSRGGFKYSKSAPQ